MTNVKMLTYVCPDIGRNKAQFVSLHSSPHSILSSTVIPPLYPIHYRLDCILKYKHRKGISVNVLLRSTQELGQQTNVNGGKRGSLVIVNNYPIKKEVWLEKYGHDPTKSPRISVTDFQQCSQGTMNTLLECSTRSLHSSLCLAFFSFALPDIKLNLSVMPKTVPDVS